MGLIDANDIISKTHCKTKQDVRRFLTKLGVKYFDEDEGLVTTEEMFSKALLNRNEPQILLGLDEVIKLIGKQRGFIIKQRKDGRFPQPVGFSGWDVKQMHQKWRKTDVLEWVDGKRNWSSYEEAA